MTVGKWWSLADRDSTPAYKAGRLFQLSEGPILIDRSTRLRMVGLGRFELPTSPLSGVRSNQLSYRPILDDLTHLSIRSGGAL